MVRDSSFFCVCKGEGSSTASQWAANLVNRLNIIDSATEIVNAAVTGKTEEEAKNQERSRMIKLLSIASGKTAAQQEAEAGDIPYSQYIKQKEAEQKENTAENGGEVYSIDKSNDIIVLPKNNELSKSIKNLQGADKYKKIQQYILEVLSGDSIKLSDGKTAVVDKRDALHIANKSGSKKTAEISQIKQIIEKAELYAEDTNVKHNKFDYFCYYHTKVEYDGNVFSLFINVGRAKNDGKYHIYDITEKIRDTANRINGLERPKPNEGYALKNDVSNDIIDQNKPTVNSKSMQEGKNYTYSTKEISQTDKKKQAERKGKVKNLCDLFGLSLEWDESIKRGKYNPNTRTVFINPNLTLTEMYIEVLKHEFTHDLENRKLYKGFKEFLFGKSINFRDYCETALKNDYGEELKGDEAIKRLTELKYRDYMSSDEMSDKEKAAFDNEAAEREIVADFVANRLLGGIGADGKFEREAYEALKELSEYHRSGFQRFVDWIKELINKIKGQPTFKDMADELEYLNKQIANVYDSKVSTNKTTHVGDKHYIAYDSKGNKYWKIETEKDIFKGLKTTEEYKEVAYKYILGMRNNNVVVDAIDGKKMSFIRLSAEEFTHSEESQELKDINPMMFAQKMRLIPSIDDLAANANINWTSPDLKNHKLFKEKGFENFRGRVGIDNVIFNFVIRSGKAKFGDVFYDINLEVDQYLPHTQKGASDIKGSTSKNSIRNNSEKVKENSDITDSHSIAVPFSEEFKADKRKRYAEGLVKKYGGNIDGAEEYLNLKFSFSCIIE